MVIKNATFQVPENRTNSVFVLKTAFHFACLNKLLHPFPYSKQNGQMSGGTRLLYSAMLKLYVSNLTKNILSFLVFFLRYLNFTVKVFFVALCSKL